jgi:hypothetical protein
MRRVFALSAAATAAVAIAACGGSSSSHKSSDPAGAVKTYLSSLANGDGAGACGVLSTPLQSRALAAARSQGIKASDCASLFSQVKAHMSAAQRNGALNPHISRVSQSGSTATVTISGARNPITLQQSGGKWLIVSGVA